MASFDEREKNFEKKYQKDQELQFKAVARRNRLLGLWAADLMGMKGEAAEGYAKSVVQSDFERAGDDDVLEKIVKDFQSKGVGQSQHQVRRKMDELLGVAKEQIMKDVR